MANKQLRHERMIRPTSYSGVACMYAQMLKHPHHFDRKKIINKDMFAAVKLGGIRM